MYCEACRCERLGTLSKCVRCGGALSVRDRATLEAELTHVRWALDDVPVWEAHEVGPAARAWVQHRLRMQERALVQALVPEVRHIAAAPLQVASAAPSPGPRAPSESLRAPGPHIPAAAPPKEVLGARGPGLGANASSAPPQIRRVDAEAPRQSPEARVVEAASSWNRIWRPFLNESVGWFIGAFLILAGTFYFVADVWNDLGAEGQALLVFAGTAVWTCGFFAWAKFLFRREVTRSAGRVLKLIAAVIAPLPTVALWPLAGGWALAFWPLLAVWALIAAQLAREVAREYDPTAEWPLALGMATTAIMMALAPLAARLGHPVLWLILTPLLTLALLARQGPREKTEAQAFSMLAPLYLLGLFATRLVIALQERGAMPPLATLTAFAAAALCLLLELREAPARKSADAWAVAVVAMLVGLAGLSVLGEAPAFFVTCSLGAVTCARLAQRGPSEVSARWLYGTYGFAYFAWQACGQLVPGVLLELLAAIKNALGYAPSEPLPPSYNAVYAAAYVVAVGIFALVRARSSAPRLKASAPVLLRATVVLSVLVAAMALPVVAQDARPTVFSLPFVAALCLVVAHREGRKDAGWAGALLTALSAVGFAFLPHVPAALALALAALLAAGLARLQAPDSRLQGLDSIGLPLSIAAAALCTATAVVGFAGPAQWVDVVALAIAAGAALVTHYRFEAKGSLALEAALALLPLTAARAGQMFGAPEAVLALGGASLAMALGGLLGKRAAFSRVATVFALCTPVLGFVLGWAMGNRLDVAFVLSAAALAVAGARDWRGCVAITLGAAALFPKDPGIRTFLSQPLVSLVAGFLAAAGSAFWSWRGGRNWHAGVLAFCALVVGTGGGFLLIDASDSRLVLATAAVTWLVAGRALLPSLTFPVAAILLTATWPFGDASLGLMPAVVAAFGLLQRWRWGRAHLLGGARLAWCATVTGVVLLGLALAFAGLESQPDEHVLLSLAAGSLLVPLLGVAATRNPLPILALVPALAPVAFHLGVAAWFPAVAVLSLSRAVHASSRVRRLLGLEGDIEQGALHWLLAIPLGLVAGALALTQSLSLVPAAAAVALCAARPVSMRLGAAAVVLLAAPALYSEAALVLVAVAFFALHAPKLAAKLLGAEPDASTVPLLAICALGFAAISHAVPGGEAMDQLAIVIALAGAGLLLKQPAFFGALVVMLAYPFAQWGHIGLERGVFVALAFAGAAAALTWEPIAARVKPLLGEVRPALWWGALCTALVATASNWAHLQRPELSAVLFVVAGLLLVTRAVQEEVSAGVLLGLVAATAVPAPWAGAALGAVGLGLCAFGTLRKRGQSPWPVSRGQRDGASPAGEALSTALKGTVPAWTGGALSILAIALCGDLHHPAIALTWSAATASVWLLVRGRAKSTWLGWLATLATAHVVLFWGGLTFSHGDPKQLILPWVSAASLVLGALALRRSGEARVFGYVAAVVGLCELLAGLISLDGTWPREAVVATVGVLALLYALVRNAAEEDSGAPAVFGQAAAAMLWAAWHVLGFGGRHGTLDSLALLVLGLVAHGLSAIAARRERPDSARMLALGAYAWPLVAVSLVGDLGGRTLGFVLLGAAAHYAWLAQAGRWKRTAALLSAAAFNVSLLTLWLAAGWSSAFYLFIVAGLSALVLVRWFEGDLGPEWSARVRGLAAATIYAAAAWKPLAFDTTWALWLCVLVCVLGVGAGIALRVRSYVYLGTGFLVTSVLSNLIRFGVREPRVGALLLSSLGLIVVAFMVVVTTRRSELLQRYQKVQTMLAAWE